MWSLSYYYTHVFLQFSKSETLIRLHGYSSWSVSLLLVNIKFSFLTSKPIYYLFFFSLDEYEPTHQQPAEVEADDVIKK